MYYKTQETQRSKIEIRKLEILAKGRLKVFLCAEKNRFDFVKEAKKKILTKELNCKSSTSKQVFRVFI